MYLGRERRIIGMYNSFIEERILDKVDDYDEMLWQIKCIALGWHLLEEKQIISIEKYLIRIKKEVEARYRANKLDIKFLCNTGEVLYYINSKVCNIIYFIC